MSDDSRTERMPREPPQRDSGAGVGATQGLFRGEQFGRYLILREIGAGGMGVVYAAHDPVLDRKVALKVLKTKVENEEAEQRLLREAQAMARLNHPNVVTVHDAGAHDGQPFVAMEFIQGRDLSSWLKARDRSWREIVAAFADAGEGLAAAHDAGLVHRDFKLSNVMLGDDGRVRVTDFGLARATESDDMEAGETVAMGAAAGQRAAEGSSSPLDSPLTEDGSLLGTPSFMAPEQAFEYRADKLSDQFSFCVSLFVALFGRHPFGDASTIPEYLSRLQICELDPPPAGHDVSGTVTATIERGLSRVPDDRFPDMHELLDELRFDPKIKRKRMLAIVVAAAVAVAIVVGFTLNLAHRRKLCSAGESRASVVWNSDRAAMLEARFATVAGPVGADVMAALQARLDSYAQRWSDIYRDACDATHIRNERSEELLDRQMACLDRRLSEADHLLALLAVADRGLVAASLDAVVGLSSPEVCEDVLAMVDRLPPPEDTATRSRIEEIEESLAAAEADSLVGDYNGALNRLAGADASARNVDYPPLLAEVLINKGYVEAELGLADEAEASLRGALAAAEAGRDDRAGVEAAANLVFVAGYLQDDFEDAEHWWELASAKIARLGGEERLEADLGDNRAAILVRAGRYAEARVVQERALESTIRLHGPRSIEAAMSMSTTGHVLSSVGEYAEAADYYERSLALKEELIGPDHPSVSFTVVSLAQAYGGLGDNQKTVDLARRALAIQERVFGVDDPQIAIALNNLAFGLEGLGRLDEARQTHRRSIEVVSNSWGPDNPQIAYSLLNLSSVEKKAGDYEAALAISREAGEILMSAYGPDHPIFAYAANNTGVFLMLTGRPEEGVVHLERALAIREAEAGDPVLVAVTRFNLGRALWEAGQTTRGRRLVQQAAVELVDIGDRAADDLEAVNKWLAEHR